MYEEKDKKTVSIGEYRRIHGLERQRPVINEYEERDKNTVSVSEYRQIHGLPVIQGGKGDSHIEQSKNKNNGPFQKLKNAIKNLKINKKTVDEKPDEKEMGE